MAISDLTASFRRTAMIGVAAASLCTAAAGDTLKISEIADYSSGHYGQEEPTEIYYDALSGTYENGLTTLRVTIPYLWINGSPNVRPDIGVVTTGGGPTGEFRRGIGDLVVGLSQGITPDSLPGTEIDFTGKIKFATASASAGLGTGANDYYAEVGVTQDFGGGWIGYGSLGRRFVGKPVGITSHLHDVWYGSLGGQRSFDWGGSVALSVDGRDAASSTGGRDIAVMAAFTQKLEADLGFTLFAARGLTQDASEWEFGLSIGYKFEP